MCVVVVYVMPKQEFEDLNSVSLNGTNVYHSTFNPVYYNF